jgi:hypothetical protein
MITILNYCNAPSEMDLMDVLDICRSANEQNARVTLLPGILKNMPALFSSGVVVVWKTHPYNIVTENELVEALITLTK